MPDDDRDGLPQVWTPEHEAQAAQAERGGKLVGARVSRAANWSLVLGLLSWLCCGPLTAVPALVLGLFGLRNTGNRGMLGRGRAWMGLILAIASMVVWGTFFAREEWRVRALMVIERLRDQAGDVTDGGPGPNRNERKATRALRRLRAAQEKHKVAHGTYARGLGSLIADDPDCAPIAASYNKRAPYNGYYFASITKRGADFVDHTREFLILAFPAESGRSGHRSFTIDASGAVRGKDVGGGLLENAEKTANWPHAD